MHIEDILWKSSLECAGQVYDEVRMNEEGAIAEIYEELGNPIPGLYPSPETPRKCFHYFLGIVNESIDKVCDNNSLYGRFIGNTRNELVGLIEKRDNVQIHQSKRKRLEISIFLMLIPIVAWILLISLYQIQLLPFAGVNNSTFELVMYLILVILFCISVAVTFWTKKFHRVYNELREAIN